MNKVNNRQFFDMLILQIMSFPRIPLNLLLICESYNFKLMIIQRPKLSFVKQVGTAVTMFNSLSVFMELFGVLVLGFMFPCKHTYVMPVFIV